MIIRNETELNLFKKAIDRCRSAVLLLTPEGKQYDLTKPVDCIKGIAELMNRRRDHLEPEVLTNCIEDEMNIFDFIRDSRALQAV